MPIILNTLTGRVGFEPQWLVDDPKIGQYLKVVPEGTKPLTDGMFKAGTVEEFNVANNNYPDGATASSEPANPETSPADENSPAHDPDGTVLS
jgi:hypothetical protein